MLDSALRYVQIILCAGSNRTLDKEKKSNGFLLHDFPYSPNGSPLHLKSSRRCLFYLTPYWKGPQHESSQLCFCRTKGLFACVCVYDVGGDSYSLIVMISHLQKAHQGSIEDFNSSLGCWHKALSHYVVLPCWTVAAVMAVLPSFLEVLGISRENHLCANEDYDTAGCNLSVNGSVSDS